MLSACLPEICVSDLHQELGVNELRTAPREEIREQSFTPFIQRLKRYSPYEEPTPSSVPTAAPTPGAPANPTPAPTPTTVPAPAKEDRGILPVVSPEVGKDLKRKLDTLEDPVDDTPIGLQLEANAGNAPKKARLEKKAGLPAAPQTSDVGPQQKLSKKARARARKAAAKALEKAAAAAAAV